MNPVEAEMICAIYLGKIYGLARGYKTFFMLNSAEHEIFFAHKCRNDNNSWPFSIYEQGKIAF